MSASNKAAAAATLMRLAAARFARSVRRVFAHRGGTSIIELAFASPTFLMFIFGIIEFGRVLWLQSALDYSVGEAVRCAAISCSADIPAYAAGRSGANLTSDVFSYSTATCGKQVTASYPVSLNVPFVTLSFTLSSQACFPT